VTPYPAKIPAFSVCYETGNVVMAGESLRNISDRKHAEDTLRGTNQVLEVLVNASEPAIIVL